MPGKKKQIALLQQVNEIVQTPIQTQREKGMRWLQTSWRHFSPRVKPKFEDNRCQTSMCFAGWAVELSPKVQWLWSAAELAEHDRRRRKDPDYEWVYHEPDVEVVVLTPKLLAWLENSDDIAPNYDGTYGHVISGGPKDGTRVISAAIAARYLLGLDGYWSAALFEGSNTRADIRRMVEKIIDRKTS